MKISLWRFGLFQGSPIYQTNDLGSWFPQSNQKKLYTQHCRCCFLFSFFFGGGCYKVAALNTWISRNVGGSFTHIYLDKARVGFQSHIINKK